MRSCLALLCVVANFYAATGLAATEAEILALIDTLRPVATAIAIDGDLSDWNGIPFSADPVGDAGADPDLDITSFAMAPVADGVFFAVTTVGTLPDLGSFVVGLDFARGPRSDFEIDIDASGNVHSIMIFDDTGQPDFTTTITGLELAVGSQTIEMKIPYTALATALPMELADALDPAVHRSWVRGGMLSESAPGTTLDDSPRLASFRLIPTPYALDPPLPTTIVNAGEPPVELELPLEGRWFVGQGADGSFTHSGAWSYDLIVLNDDLFASVPDMSLDNDDYFAFGQPLFAPAVGTVTISIGGNPDNVPFTPGFTNNNVQVDLGAGFEARLLHAKQNTTLVGIGDPVDPTTQVAEVGNSGFSFQPHLHIDVLDALTNTHPLAFRDVDVALNPANDPWLRHVPIWEPRDGFFVTAVPEPSASLMSLTAIAAIAFLRSVSRSSDPR